VPDDERGLRKQACRQVKLIVVSRPRQRPASDISTRPLPSGLTSKKRLCRQRIRARQIVQGDAQICSAPKLETLIIEADTARTFVSSPM